MAWREVIKVAMVEFTSPKFGGVVKVTKVTILVPS